MARRTKVRLEDLERASGGLRLYAQFGMRLPGELAFKLKSYCRSSGRSLNETVTTALEQYLARELTPHRQNGSDGVE